MPRITCMNCHGEGVERDRETDCEDCDGSGNQRCESRSCREDAIGFNDEGKALCEDCLFEWQCEEASP